MFLGNPPTLTVAIDTINHPSHYTVGKIEVYDFIDAWKLDFTIGNVIKYVARSPYKGNKLEDLRKARWYLNKAIEKEEEVISQRVAETLDSGGGGNPAKQADTICRQHIGVGMLNPNKKPG